MAKARRTSSATTSAHTPGPWEIDSSAIGGLSINAGYTRICRIAFGDAGTSVQMARIVAEIGRKNASLIAAAPELLKACTAFLAVSFDAKGGKNEQVRYARAL